MSSTRKLFLFIGLPLVVIFGIVAFLALGKNETTPTPTPTTQDSSNNSDQKKSSFQFTRLPFDDDKVAAVTPIGSITESTRAMLDMSHALPHVRHYLHSAKPGTAYNVYVPGDGTVSAMRFSSTTGEYRFNFTIDDERFYYLDHIQALDPAFEAKVKENNNGQIPSTSAVDQIAKPFAVKAGELIGQTGVKGIAWDWGFVDTSYTTGIVNPTRLNGATDLYPRSVYDFASAEVKVKLDALAGEYNDPAKGGNGFTASVLTPKLGTWGQDAKGTLAGLWVKEGPMPTLPRPVVFKKDNLLENAFTIRLGIPELTIVGLFEKLKPEGNLNPDPAKVTKDTGIVAYTLLQKYVRAGDEYGILLARVNADDSITLETLKGVTTAPANPTFSDKAVTLSR